MKNYHIALLTVTQMDIGITALAGVLQHHGIKTMLINLQSDEFGPPDRYPREVVTHLMKLLQGISHVGISTQDLFFPRALFIADAIKERFPNIPIILGGIHAELYPRECIAHQAVDAVCVGDGYQAILDFVKKWPDRENASFSNTKVKLDDGTIRDPGSFDYYLSKDLDKTPFPDFSYDYYWILDGKNIIHLKNYGRIYPFSHHQIGHENTYVTSFMTGCIHNCLYCNNWSRFLKHQEYAGQNLPRVRFKSPSRMIKELIRIRQEHPYVVFFNIMDNDFCARPLDQIRDFSRRYKAEIDLPFYVMASPDTVTREKLSFLIKAGLVELNIGLQTISRVNCEMYNRDLGTDEKILAMAKMVSEFAVSGKIDIFYDFIIFNPAMTRDDMLEMIAFIGRLPLPFDQVSHHLTLGPEVVLYHKFREEGKILPRDLRKIYESDYHELELAEYRDFPNLYLNLFLEWTAGRHDEDTIGRLPRQSERLLQSPPFCAAAKYAPELVSTVERHMTACPETRELLLMPEVRNIFDNDFQLLDVFNSHMEPVVYSNQQQ